MQPWACDTVRSRWWTHNQCSRCRCLSSGIIARLKPVQVNPCHHDLHDGNYGLDVPAVTYWRTLQVRTARRAALPRLCRRLRYADVSGNVLFTGGGCLEIVGIIRAPPRTRSVSLVADSDPASRRAG